MFEYQVDEAIRSRSSVTAERRSAQKQWPFLTAIDFSMIHNEMQLAVMVRDRTRMPQAAAELEVRSWVKARASDEEAAAAEARRLAEDDGGIAAYYPGATMRRAAAPVSKRGSKSIDEDRRRDSEAADRAEEGLPPIRQPVNDLGRSSGHGPDGPQSSDRS